MADRILDSFDVWIGAQGWKSKLRLRNVDNINLKGISRLRKLILELAVRGKLVPQVSTDEPASLLLEKIRAEKAQLLKVGKLKKQESFSEISEEEKLFDLPKGWCLVRFGDLILEAYTGLDKGKSFQSLDFKYPYFKMNNILNEGGFDLSEMTHVDASDVEVEKYSLSDNDFLFNTRNSRELVGKTCVIKGLSNKKIIYNNNILRVKFSQVWPDFIDVWFRCGSGKSLLEKIKSNTTNVCAIYQGKLFDFVCVVPPLAEQLRIVAKVDELMALCDELELQETNHLKTHQLLVETLLGTLTQAKDAAEFQAAWATLAQHFDDLFITEDSIDQLKQTILQLAVMGKLVPQDPKDEPANVLLERIKKEKERMVKEGEINKQRPLPEIEESEIPFILPNKWSWTRLGNAGIGSTGKTPSTSVINFFGGEIPFIGPGQISNEGDILESDRTLTEEGSNYSTIAQAGDILMVCIGGSIGKTAIVKSKLTFNQQINCMRPFLIDSSYLNFVMNSTHFHRELLDKATGSATPIINKGKWEELLVSIPPFAEQQRIVSKVDELFALCDRLKERITESQKVVNLMADSIVEQVA